MTLRICLIDDKWTKAEADVVCPEDAEIDVRAITDEEPEAFSTFDLILLDQNLGVTPALTTVFDGSGVASQMRALARKDKVSLPPLVILTSEPDLFEFEIPSVGPERPFGGSFIGREAHLAPTLDVEWLLLKPDFADEAAVDLTRGRISDLATSYRSAVTLAGTNGVSMTESAQFLGLDTTQPWGAAATVAIAASLPPISEDPANDDAPPRAPASLIRWLLHRALPYPGLFMSDLQVSARLGVSVDDLDLLVGADGPWAAALSTGRYTGPGATLLARRWWTSAVDFAALELFETLEGTGAASAFKSLAGVLIAPLGIDSPVVVSDERFVETAVAPLETAVQVRPPGWPVEAMLPWLTIETAASHPWLRYLVDPADAREVGLA